MMRKGMHGEAPWDKTDKWPGSSVLRGTEQLEFRAVLRELDHTLESQPDLFQYRDRTLIVGYGNGHDPRQVQLLPAMGQNGGGRFGGISLRPVPRQERKAHIDVGKVVALHQTADPDGHPAVTQTRQ